MADQRDLQVRLAAALADNQRLRDEIRHLKALNGVPPAESKKDQPDRTPCLPTVADIAQMGTLTDNKAKVTLFRSLFRGREDVYAERWRTKDGTWAYRPSGKKNWTAVGVPAYLERSRSGNGGHVWIFFELPISAILARKPSGKYSNTTMVSSALPRPLAKQLWLPS